MNEEEKIAYYRNNRSKNAVPIDLPTEDSPSKRLGSIVSVRFAMEEVKLLRSITQSLGISLSEYVRKSSLGLSREFLQTLPTTIATEVLVNANVFSSMTYINEENRFFSNGGRSFSGSETSNLTEQKVSK